MQNEIVQLQVLAKQERHKEAKEALKKEHYKAAICDLRAELLEEDVNKAIYKGNTMLAVSS